ncbi:hypothetical protein PQ460_00300 [Paenibacillus sp. KACC 21273]|uniref:hypothetical protein n=1 Tax=Paenibacillus sp. KACC 21273 TaxID=3025665 RepID=UPI00236693AE|nr:hypothetical protein [Paenibacillus sp. KACC 21273]WDF50929.1 hypothetical protein PQ460_00300 [Paenibacillus sp. KACC 21273]
MEIIQTQLTIEVNENVYERIKQIFAVAQEYNLTEVVKNNIVINSSDEKIYYTLNVSKAEFENYPNFKMKLLESAYSNKENLSITKLKSYSYHAFHSINPSKEFIRFDFEPFKQKYAPIHINANKQRWGDHLVYPDDTNLDISKMSCPIALKIFKRYAKDKDDFPTNQETNEEYVKIIEM